MPQSAGLDHAGGGEGEDMGVGGGGTDTSGIAFLYRVRGSRGKKASRLPVQLCSELCGSRDLFQFSPLAWFYTRSDNSAEPPLFIYSFLFFSGGEGGGTYYVYDFSASGCGSARAEFVSFSSASSGKKTTTAK